MAKNKGATFTNSSGTKVNFTKSVLGASRAIDSSGLRILRAVGYMARADIAKKTMRSSGPRSVKLADSSTFPRSQGADGRRKAGVPLMGHRVTGNSTLVITSIVANLFDGGRTLRGGSTEAGKGILSVTGAAILGRNLQKYADRGAKKILPQVVAAWNGKK